MGDLVYFPSRPLESSHASVRALAAAVEYWPGRWCPSTVAAALAMPQMPTFSAQQWVDILDRIERALRIVIPPLPPFMLDAIAQK